MIEFFFIYKTILFYRNQLKMYGSNKLYGNFKVKTIPVLKWTKREFKLPI